MGIRFLFLSFFLLSSFARAEDYVWVDFIGSRFPSPGAACSAYADENTQYSPIKQSETRWLCLGVRKTDGANMSYYVDRLGDGCPAGATYDSATGQCSKPPQECKTDDVFPAKGSIGGVVSSGGKSYVSSKAPESACYSGCKFTPVSDARPSSCYKSKSDPTQGWCNYILKATGDNCTDADASLSETGAQLNPSDTPNVPDSNPNDPLCPPGWSNSNGTCFKDPNTPDTGSGGTGGSDGGSGGTGGSGGGSGGTGGSGGSGGGTGGSDHSSGAAGDLDNSTKGGTKTEGEECKPRADGSGCDGPVVNGEDCDVVLECSGDAIQCAILRKQKRLVCDMQYDSKARNFVETQVSKDDYKLKTSDIDGSQLFTSGVNASRWLPASCPAPKSISVMGHSETFTFDPACRAATALGPILVALAGIFFAVYVGRAFGGN